VRNSPFLQFVSVVIYHRPHDSKMFPPRVPRATPRL
jgi:hypothetical protein